MATALQASANEWTAVASDGGSEGKKSVTRRGAVGLDIGKTDDTAGWTGDALLTVADRAAVAAEVIEEAIAIQAAMKSRRKFQFLVDKGAVRSQLRYIIRHGGAAPREPKAFSGLWNLVSAATRKSLLKPSWCPSHGKRPEWKCEPPTSTGAARELNDKADKEAGEALAAVKQKVEASEEKIEEDVKWAQRALQAVAKLYNEYVEHFGLVTNNRTAEVGGLNTTSVRGSALTEAHMGPVIQVQQQHLFTSCP